jgi:hypothetical protein
MNASKSLNKSKSTKQKVNVEKKLVRSAVMQVQKEKNKAAKSVIKKEMSAVKSMVHTSSGVSEHKTALEQLMCTLTLPGVEETQRWSSPYSSKKTAVAEPFSVIPANWGQVPTSTSGGYYQQLSQSETALILFRNPLRAAVFYDQNGVGSGTSYQAQFDDISGPTDTVYAAQVGSIPLNFTPEVSFLVPTTSYAPHGPKLFCGSVTNHGGSYIWADAQQTIRCSVSCPTATGLTPVSVQLILDSYSSEGFAVETYIGNVILTSSSSHNLSPQFSAGGSEQQIGLPGYYAPRFVVSANSASTVNNTVAITDLRVEDFIVSGPYNGVSHFCHNSLPYLSANSASTRGIRITGLSAMYTNTSAEIQLGGTVSGYQSGTDDNWQSYLSYTGQPSLQNVSSAQDSVTLNASRGMYAYMKPTDERDFNFKDDLVTDINGNICDTSYSLDAEDSFVIIVVSNPNPAGCSGYYTFRYAVEYLTSDPWRSTGISMIDEALSSQAIARIRDLPQFYENTTHWSDIFDKIKSVVGSVANAAVKYGPWLLKGASMLV